ncbi:MAG TPA: ABC transporter substrate-binding protein [Sporichthyaceae bacterium]|nr:ABC transporter substrate-binding protein [Sporichthyaceae bacterium]
MRRWQSAALKTVPVVAATSLVLAACGSSGGSANTAEQAAAPSAGQGAAAPAQAAAPAAGSSSGASQSAPASGGASSSKSAETSKSKPAASSTKTSAAAPSTSAAAPSSSGTAASPAVAPGSNATGSKSSSTKSAKASKSSAGAPAAASSSGSGGSSSSDSGGSSGSTKVKPLDSGAAKAQNQQIYNQKQGATDVGVTKDTIKLGSVNMHGMALGNVLVTPQVHGDEAAMQAINDRGGVLGRRMALTDCDDGPGEVARAKACIKKLVGTDQVFSLVTGVDWATASIHDDLKQYHLPYVGAWAYSQTEWQDPFMFPTHMSMIHEAMANAHWVVNTIKPKSYGLVCLTSPEMQLACNGVQQIMNGAGAKMVKRADVSISETSMSAYVLAMRAANPEHIIHYVINPATMAKFMVEAAQQGYYPPKGISGNHLAAEVLGSIFGQFPVNRYWTNTTYKLWGPEFMATMNKYARFNRGTNHHIVQAGYVAMNIFATAAKEVGPNLTRDRIMSEIGNGTVWQADSSLDQRFSYVQSERSGDNWSKDNGQGREFIYKYTSTNTVSNPDGSPSGFVPDSNQFVIHTNS